MMSKSVRKSILRGLALTVVSSLLIAIQAFSTQSQWVTNGNNINNNNTGNVGMGTTTPTFLLDVSGSTDSPFRVRDSSGREYFSTTTRTGAIAAWTYPVVSLAVGLESLEKGTGEILVLLSLQ